MPSVNTNLSEEPAQSVPLSQIGEAYRTNIATGTVATLPPASKRYDEASVQRVLKMALELQHEFRKTLTAEQIVSIGEEAGIDREFVLQALARIDREDPKARHLTAGEYEELVHLRGRVGLTQLSALPRNAKRAAIVIPAVYTFLTLLQINSGSLGPDSHPPLFLNANISVIAPLLAFSSGVMLRSKRLGFAVGFTIGLGLMLDLLIWQGSPLSSLRFDDVAVNLLILAGAGSALGIAGAAIRNAGPNVCRYGARRLARRSGRQADAQPPP